MTRAEAIVYGVLAACVTALLGTIGVHCQLATRDLRRTCIEQGNHPLECERVGVG